MAILDNIERSAKSVIEVPGDFAKAGMEMFMLENPLPKMKESVKRGLWDTVALGPRMVRDVTVGVLKGTLKLTWNLIKLLPLPLPVLDSWKKERGNVTMRTKDALEALKLFSNVDSKFELPRPLPAAQQQQDVTPRALAA